MNIERQNGVVKLRKRKLQKGYSLFLEYVINGRRKYEFLNLYLVEEKTRIDKFRNMETLRTAEAVKAQRVVSIQNLDFGFVDKRKTSIVFVEYIEAKAKELYKGKNGTLHELIYHLKEYAPNAKITEINRKFLLGFIGYLRNVRNKMNGGKLANNTIWTICNKMNAFLNRAVRDDIIKTNPYTLLDTSERALRERTKRPYLTIDEVKLLIDTPCRNDDIKRAFLFCCFCGLRFSDTSKLIWDNIKTLSDGSKQVEITQQKTSEPLYLPLSQNALKFIVEPKKKTPKKHVFDLPTYTYCARIIREWTKAAGLTKKVTFHVSRHTAATLFLTYGADLYTVSKLLGHTNIKTTQIYAKVVDENKRKAVDLIPNI